MSTGTDLRDGSAFGRYVRERIVTLAPAEEPVPFRGRAGIDAELLPFADDMDAALLGRGGAVWNVTGPSGSGKTLLARWSAARWGRRFLEKPDSSPVVLWIDAARLRNALKDDRALTGGPFAFALAAEVPGESPETIARHLTKHPVIAIVDKDEDPQLAPWKLELPIGLPPGFRVLHLALRDSLGGPGVHLDLWDRETALLFAHQKHGAEGVALVEALLGSPFAALAALPAFLAWLVGPERPSLDDARSGACIVAYLRHFHGGELEASSLAGWGSEVLSLAEDTVETIVKGIEATSRPADRSSSTSHLRSGSKLHLVGPVAHKPIGKILRAALLAEVLQGATADKILARGLISHGELELLARLPWTEAARSALRESLKRCLRSMEELSFARLNAINLRWWICREAVKLPKGDRSGLRLPGYAFDGPVDHLRFSESDLSGATFAGPLIQNCTFTKTSLRSANFAGARLSECIFRDVSLELAELSGCIFEGCWFENVSLAEAMTGGAIFARCEFDRVTFGFTAEADPLSITTSKLTACDLSRAAPAGIRIAACEVSATNLAGLKLKSLDAEGSRFSGCDMIGMVAPGAKLKKAYLTKCLLADVDLSGADLREAELKEVEFQPGPSSRAGMTDELTRPDALHGSKSGFYAQDLAEGVYADPELTRTADLRGADLRGATFRHTDLFRVDLRGARLDPKVEEQARRMRAFVDE